MISHPVLALDSMSSIQALLEQKRKAVEQAYGAKKALKASTLDTAHLSRVREQEQAELAKKVYAL